MSDEVEWMAGDGVREGERLGVQEVSAVAGEPGEVLERLPVQAVERIADERVTDGSQVNSDLMRTAGTEADLEGGGVCGARDDAGY